MRSLIMSNTWPDLKDVTMEELRLGLYPFISIYSCQYLCNQSKQPVPIDQIKVSKVDSSEVQKFVEEWKQNKLSGSRKQRENFVAVPPSTMSPQQGYSQEIISQFLGNSDLDIFELPINEQSLRLQTSAFMSTDTGQNSPISGIEPILHIFIQFSCLEFQMNLITIFLCEEI